MSGLRNTIKGGWHPEGKEGGKESWRGDFKGINQVVSSLTSRSCGLATRAAIDADILAIRPDGWERAKKIPPPVLDRAPHRRVVSGAKW